MNYIADLESYGLDFKSSDFRPTAKTVPAGAEIDVKTQTHNPQILDEDDKIRCDEMFQNFMRTPAHISSSTVKSV